MGTFPSRIHVMHQWSGFLSFWKNRHELKRFNTTDPEARRIVFYAHAPQDWLVLEPIMLELNHQFKQPICYVTHNPDDPIRHMPPVRIHPFFVEGEFQKRHFLQGLECQTLVICNSLAVRVPFPRSAKVKNYAYLCPSLMSIRGNIASENLKLIELWLCAAEHQMLDLLRLKTEHNLTCKVFACGSTRLDRTLKMMADTNNTKTEETPTAFFAFSNPSLEFRDTVCTKVIDDLLGCGFQVIFRCPKQWMNRKGNLIRPLFDRFSDNPRFFPEGEQASRFSIYRTDLLITDDAECATEFGLALEYPVILLDTGGTQGSSSGDFESGLPSVMGAKLPVSSLEILPSLAKECVKRKSEISQKIRLIREKELINPGRCALTAALILTERIKIPSESQVSTRETHAI